MDMEPESPELVVPVENVSAPLTPFSPESRVLITVVPEDVAVPYPETRDAAPLVI
jgi:hypothetical protein